MGFPRQGGDKSDGGADDQTADKADDETDRESDGEANDKRANAADNAEELALARSIEKEVQRHGGEVKANFLLLIRPDIRKQLGDRKLLHFLRAFPELVDVRPDQAGGHRLRSCADPSKPSGEAPTGSTLPCNASPQAVHALRQLERELVWSLAAREGKIADVSWLMYNGKARRKIGAVVCFLPIAELIFRDDGQPEASEQSCPLSAYSRTCAGYLDRFIRDRPERFLMKEGRVQLVATADVSTTDEEEALLLLIAGKIMTLGRASGSLRVPLARVGRDTEVHKALLGRSLLQQLERDADARAARRLPPRFILDTHCSTFTVAVRAEHWPSVQAPEVAPLRPRVQRSPSVQVHIIAQGSGVVAVSKAPGTTTEALLEALQAAVGCRIISVSRLDRDTSGVLVAATSTEGADCLTAQFKEHRVYKRYVALCSGRLAPGAGEVNARLFISGFAEKYRAYVSPKGKNACTRYEVLMHLRREGFGGVDELLKPLQRYRCEGEEQFSLVSCVPVTGRTHQIRAHLAWRGHPLVADANYTSRGQAREHFQWCPRLWLHCQCVRIRDLEGRELEVQAPVPEDLREVLRTRLTPEGNTSLLTLDL